MELAVTIRRGLELTIGVNHMHRFALEIYRRWFFLRLPFIGAVHASPGMGLTFDRWEEVKGE